MSISDLLLPEFDQEMTHTRKTLERIPEDKLAWKPHEKSMPLGRLAGHLAELPGSGIAVVRSMMLSHMVHHRAQLGVYLRLNNVPVPSIYGPSADEGGM